MTGRGPSCRHFDTSVLSYREASLQRRVVLTARCISATPQWWKEKVEIVTGQIAMIALTWLAGKSMKITELQIRSIFAMLVYQRVLEGYGHFRPGFSYKVITVWGKFNWWFWRGFRPKKITSRQGSLFLSTQTSCTNFQGEIHENCQQHFSIKNTKTHTQNPGNFSCLLLGGAKKVMIMSSFYDDLKAKHEHRKPWLNSLEHNHLRKRNLWNQVKPSKKCRNICEIVAIVARLKVATHSNK